MAILAPSSHKCFHNSSTGCIASEKLRVASHNGPIPVFCKTVLSILLSEPRKMGPQWSTPGCAVAFQCTFHVQTTLFVKTMRCKTQ